MKDRFKLLLSRIPWRLLFVLLGCMLVAKGGAKVLSVELPAVSDAMLQLAKQGMGMVIAGGVTLIAAIMAK